jgi:hypothetical protein
LNVLTKATVALTNVTKTLAPTLTGNAVAAARFEAAAQLTKQHLTSLVAAAHCDILLTPDGDVSTHSTHAGGYKHVCCFWQSSHFPCLCY